MESARRAASAAAAAARAGAHKAGQDSGASVTSSAARAAAAPVASHTASSAPAGASSDAQGRGGPNAGAGAGDEFVGGGAAGAAGESGEGAARPGRPPPIRPTEGPAPGATSHAGTPGAAHDGDDEVALVAGIDTPADKAGAYQLPSGTLGPEPVRSPTAADHADRPSSGAFGGVAGSSGEGGWAPDLAGAAGSAAPRAHSRHGTVDSQASNRTAPAASGPQARCSTPEAGALAPRRCRGRLRPPARLLRGGADGLRALAGLHGPRPAADAPLRGLPLHGHRPQPSQRAGGGRPAVSHVLRRVLPVRGGGRGRVRRQRRSPAPRSKRKSRRSQSRRPWLSTKCAAKAMG